MQNFPIFHFTRWRCLVPQVCLRCHYSASTGKNLLNAFGQAHTNAPQCTGTDTHTGGEEKGEKKEASSGRQVKMVLAEQQKQLGDDALSYWKAEVDFEDAAAAILQ